MAAEEGVVEAAALVADWVPAVLEAEEVDDAEELEEAALEDLAVVELIDKRGREWRKVSEQAQSSADNYGHRPRPCVRSADPCPRSRSTTVAEFVRARLTTRRGQGRSEVCESNPRQRWMWLPAQQW